MNIKSIKKIDYSGKVYDISCEKDHLFYCNSLDIDFIKTSKQPVKSILIEVF